MDLKKGDELKVRFSTTKFDYDDNGKIIGLENNKEFTMNLTIYDNENNIVEDSTMFSDLTLGDVIDMDFEEEMKFWIQKFAEENALEKYSLKDIDIDYGENTVNTTLVIE